MIGGSPALTGGDLIATATALGGAALVAGSGTVGGVASLIGGAGAAGAGTVASAGGASSGTQHAVASVGSVVASSSVGGDSLSPPSSPSAASMSDRAARRQPDPPFTRSPVPVSSVLASIGGELLEGSGFEAQPFQGGFARVSATSTSEGASAPASVPPAAGPNGGNDGQEGGLKSTNAGPDIGSVRGPVLNSPQLPAPSSRKNPIIRAVDQVRALRRRISSLPSDAAPHATPPRIPIEHEE